MRPAITAILSIVGGIRPLARAIGKRASTVQYWKEAGFLPRTEYDAVLAALQERGLDRGSAERLIQRATSGMDEPASNAPATVQ